jgi:phosphomannomutase
VTSALLKKFCQGDKLMKVNPGIFRAYDIRGIYPDELNEETGYAIGRAFVTFLKVDSHRRAGYASLWPANV